VADAFSAVTRLLLEGALLKDSSQDAEVPKWTPGTKLLQIGQHVVDARLPISVKVGERLPLRVVEAFPKLVFVHSPQDASAAQGTQVSMSSAARLIAEVIRTAEPGQAKPLQLAQPLPLPQSAAPHPEDIARSLKQAVERSLAELKREPQTRTYRPAVQATAVSTQLPRDAGLPDEELLPAAEKLATSSKEGSLARTPSEAPLRAQLDLIEGRPVMVAIPGWEPRELHWELPQKEREQTEGEEVWTTQLQLNFPRLGQMSARIRLAGDKLALALTAESGQTTTELAARQEALMQAFKTAGLNLSALAVNPADE
jgi:Flagellar hook-length control protein FliK